MKSCPCSPGKTVTMGRWLQFAFVFIGKKPRREAGGGCKREDIKWLQPDLAGTSARVRERQRIRSFVHSFTVSHSASKCCFCCCRSKVITRTRAVTSRQNVAFNPQQHLIPCELVNAELCVGPAPVQVAVCILCNRTGVISPR